MKHANGHSGLILANLFESVDCESIDCESFLKHEKIKQWNGIISNLYTG